MSKIDELLKDEKVEWKKLGEIAEITGAGVDKKKVLGELPIKLLNYMDVYKNQYINSNIPTMNVTAPENKIQNCNIEFGDIFVTPSSETTDDIFRSGVATEDIFNTVYSYHIMRVRLKNKSFITSCYLNYLFQSENFREKLYKRVFGNTRKTIAKSEIEQLQIPIPSIETQEKIVKTLDKFTNYVTELQSELQSRTKQYEYYRDMLLSEEYLNKISKKIDSLENKGYQVRFTTLGEIGLFTRGNGLQKKDFIEKGKPVIHYGQIYTQYGFETDRINSFVSDDIFSKLKKAKFKDILIATTSENIEDVGKSVVWLGSEEIGFSGDMYSYRTVENSKYIAYYFQTAEFQKQKEKKVTGTKLIRIHGDDMEKFLISIPPIEIQNKVVEILDKFQSLLADTKGLLPQEIEQRQKQYEYYREKLLTFDKNSVKRERERERAYLSNSYLNSLKEAGKLVGVKLYNIKWEKLENLLDYEQPSKYIVKSTNYSNDYNVPVLTAGQTFVLGFTYEEENIYKASKQNPVIIFDDFTAGNHWVDFEFKVKSSAMKMIKSNGNINLRYCYHYMQTIKIDSMEHKRLWISKYSQIKIPVPSIQVQEYIVSILDKFDSIVNDISKGLPKEIELRQKQYEYYREKLLSFDR